MNVDTSFLLVTYNNVLKAKTNIAAILAIKLKDITLDFLVFLVFLTVIVSVIVSVSVGNLILSTPPF